MNGYVIGHNKFARVDTGTWLYTGDWLSYYGAHHYSSDLSKEYPSAVCWFDKDWDDAHNGHIVFIEFKDDSDEAEFIMKCSP